MSEVTTLEKKRDRRPVMLYPISRQYPFDEAAGRVVQEMEARGFQVPGLEVRFDVYGSGAQKLRVMREIRGEDFRLYFCRTQRTLPGGRWNDTAALNQIIVGKFSLSVYEDYSGPSFVTYVGDNWEADRVKFLKGYNHPVNSKLRNERRVALKYKGAFYPPGHPDAMYTYTGRLAPYLAHDTDLGREYTPLPLDEGESPGGAWRFVNDERVAAGPPDSDAPFCLSTAKVMEYFRHWIEGTLLPRIMKEPLREVDPAVYGDPAPVPFPEGVHLFTFAEEKDVYRIRRGQDPETASELADADYYGMRGESGNSERLVHYGIADDKTFPKLAYEGFMWCGFGEVNEETPIDSLEIPGFYRWSDRMRYVVRLRPNSAHPVYVADWGAHEAARAAYWKEQELRHSKAVPNWDGKKTKKRRRVKKYSKRYGVRMVAEKDWARGVYASHDDMGEWRRAAARTLIPLAEYRGDYKQPVALVLCEHEFGFDEVDVVSGPWPDKRGRL